MVRNSFGLGLALAAAAAGIASMGGRFDLGDDILDPRPRKKFALPEAPSGPIIGAKKREGKRARRRRLARDRDQ